MKRSTFRTYHSALLLASLVLPLTAGPRGAQAQPAPPGHQLRLMTQNLYLGTDLLPVLRASNPYQLVTAVASRWAQVQRTNFPERARAIANQIEQAMPDLVGLQECSLWRTGPYDPAAPAETVVYDYLQILMDELAQRHLPYQVITVETGYDAEGPGLFATGLMDVRVTDREAVIARTDRGMELANAAGVNFDHFLSVRYLGGTFQDRRGYCTVDVRYRGKGFRFISTHLEPDHPLVNQLQAEEILAGPASAAGNVVLVGDLNSPAGVSSPFTAYPQALAAGFIDSWAALYPDDPGYTHGHDDDLMDFPSDPFTRRIDYVLFRGARLVPTGASIVGTDPADRTPSGLWPSDHAGVVVDLVVK